MLQYRKHTDHLDSHHAIHSATDQTEEHERGVEVHERSFRNNGYLMF